MAATSIPSDICKPLSCLQAPRPARQLQRMGQQSLHLPSTLARPLHHLTQAWEACLAAWRQSLLQLRRQHFSQPPVSQQASPHTATYRHSTSLSSGGSMPIASCILCC